MVERQKERYLKLYGFPNEESFAKYLSTCNIIYDAGAGMGYKAAWFAKLSPSSLVVAADLSDSIIKAAEHYNQIDNLLFVRCDISNTYFFKSNIFDYVSCDQVIHHTSEPRKTFQELFRVTKPEKDISVYVYRKKALPRELIDEYFREFSMNLDHDQLLQFSEQLTNFGKLLSNFNDKIDFPAIPLLGIEGGEMTIQRFIYYNFLKCHWNEDAGFKNSVLNNYDWYSPSQAFRYTEDEFRQWFIDYKMHEKHFYNENACYAARYEK